MPKTIALTGTFFKRFQGLWPFKGSVPEKKGGIGLGRKILDGVCY